MDRRRILEAGAKYVSQTPLTITAFPAKRSADGLHDFYCQADYFWPNPKDTSGPYINRDGQSNPENFDEHRKVMAALPIRMPALTAAWPLTGREMRVLDNHVQQAFGPASKSAIKCRIRSAVTEAEAAIATSLHR